MRGTGFIGAVALAALSASGAVGAPGAMAAPAWFESSALAGHRISLLRTGVESYDTRIRLIEQARESIYLATYMIHWDHVGISTLDALCKKAEEGVEVRVLAESFASRRPLDPYRNQIRDCGVKLVFFNPAIWDLADVMYALHEKTLIVDGRAVVTGGTNYTNTYYQASRHSGVWHDLDQLVEGPAACWFHVRFIETWRRSASEDAASRVDAMGGGGLSESMREYLYGLSSFRTCRPVSAGPSRLQPVYSNPLFQKKRERPILDAYLTVIGEAGPGSVLKIYSPYFVPDERVARALLEALGRGAAVRVLTNSKRSNDENASVVAAVYMVNQSLVAAGLELRVWEAKGTMHRKGFVLDRRLAVLGSENFDRRGMNFSSEAIFVTDDETVAGQLDEEIEEDFKLSRPVSADEMQLALRKDFSSWNRFLADLLQDYF